MEIKFGNLEQPRYSKNLKRPEAEAKVTEMMQKLHEAGFVKQENISNGVNDGKFYHIYELPYQIEFGSDVITAIKIMTPYSDYMEPLQVTKTYRGAPNQL